MGEPRSRSETTPQTMGRKMRQRRKGREETMAEIKLVEIKLAETKLAETKPETLAQEVTGQEREMTVKIRKTRKRRMLERTPLQSKTSKPLCQLNPRKRARKAKSKRLFQTLPQNRHHKTVQMLSLTSNWMTVVLGRVRILAPRHPLNLAAVSLDGALVGVLVVRRKFATFHFPILNGYSSGSESGTSNFSYVSEVLSLPDAIRN